MNPFGMVYDALWNMALASEPLAELVKPRNRIRFDEENNRDPIKQNVQAADLPELVLVPVGSQAANLTASSCESSIVRRYSFIVSTGDMRLTEGLLSVEWALFCALANWKAVLTALEHGGTRFVKNVRLAEVTNGESNPEQNRNIKGWSAVWSCEVEMRFRTESLIAELSA